MERKGKASKLSLIWTANKFQFYSEECTATYSSSLHLHESVEKNSTDSESSDGVVFIREEKVDNILKSNFDQYLGSSLRFLEAIDRRDLEFSGKFSPSYVYSHAIRTAYLERSRHNSCMITAWKIENKCYIL
jgi:hypothetical protein